MNRREITDSQSRGYAVGVIGCGTERKNHLVRNGIMGPRIRL